jgi:putative DNA primase/helicase
MNAKNGPKFQRLWEGDTSIFAGDDSRADLALCGMLGFWTGGDRSRIDSFFRQSGLYRTKWEREDYRNRTIDKALEGRTEFYQPHLQNGHKPPPNQPGELQPTTGIPEPDLLRLHATDTGNGRRLAALHGCDLRYCHPWDKWLCWDGKRWREDDRGEPEWRAKDVCCVLLRQAAQRAAELAASLKEAGDEEKKAVLTAKIEAMQGIQSFALKSESAARLAAMISLAGSEPGIPILPSDLNRDPWLLNCRNGTIELRTGKLREHRREDFITQLCPTPYHPDAKCPSWLKFLSEIFPATADAAETAGNPELIDFLQRFLGYALTGLTIEQILAIFWGVGSNGKTTLIEALLATIGPDYADTLHAAVLMVAKGDRHPTEIADLFGKRLIASMESSDGARLNEALVKQLTGSDTLKARRMREDFWSFKPTHSLILSTNHKPRITGRDHAIRRRLRLVPFTQRFAERDQHGNLPECAKEKDKGLPEKLVAETPGILAWLVQGCLSWQAHGLPTPQEVRVATDDYIAYEDVLATWISECCVAGSPNYRARASALYDSYQAWATDAGERFTMTKRQFTAALREEGLQECTSNGLWFLGISLRPPDDSEKVTE